MRRSRLSRAAAGGLLAVGLIAQGRAAVADPQPPPRDFRESSIGFDIGVPCQVRASIFVENGQVPDADPSSRVTAYYQMETRPDDGGGSYYWDAWADWNQPAARRIGSWNEFELHRQDISPVAFQRGYVGNARRWEGAMPVPTDVPPTNLPYGVWSYGFKTFGPGGQREDWRVWRDRSTNGGPASSTDNLVGVVRKTDVPVQPLPVQMRGGTGPGAADSRIVRLVGADATPRAWTAETAVTLAFTGLDTTCTSANNSGAPQRDAATNPACVPDPVTFTTCWQHAVAANSDPGGTLDYHADGVYGPSPYCAHLAGQVIVYRRADRSDCPGKGSLQQYRDLGVLPSWWCSSKTWFGFCVEAQVDWIGHRQKPVWMQVMDLASGAEAHAQMTSWYGDPQGNVSRNACDRQADGSAVFGSPRECFYEGWWQGELTVPLSSDGRHPLRVDTVDGTFVSWLNGAPMNVQNRSAALVVVHRDTVGPVVAGAMDTAVQGNDIRFSAADVRDPGSADEAIGVNAADVWLYACRRGSAGCDVASVPESGAGADHLSIRMTATAGDSFAATATGAADGEWYWKVVPYDLLGNRGEPRFGALFQGVRVDAAPDTATVPSGGVVVIDETANDVWAPPTATTTVRIVGAPTLGTASLVPRAGLPSQLRYRSTAGTAVGSVDAIVYELCASTASTTGCSQARVDVEIHDTSARRPT